MHLSLCRDAPPLKHSYFLAWVVNPVLLLPRRFATLRGLGVEWIDPTFVDWMEEGSEDVYEYWEWGKGRLGASEDENGIQPPSISPDFAVQDL